MLQYALIALPMAVVWVILTNQVSPVSFGIGYVLSFFVAATLARSRSVPLEVNPLKLPGQVFALTLYTLRLGWDILNSGVDVALRVFGLRPLNPAIVAVDTEDEEDDPLISGLSAHGITITPGNLVVDFSEDAQTMYVHMLDVNTFEPQAAREQQARVRLFRRILGYD